MRHQLRELNGGAEADLDKIYDNEVAQMAEEDLVDLDQRKMRIGREQLQIMIKQLQDIASVRTINLSGNLINDESADELARLVTLDRSAGRGEPEGSGGVGFAGLDLSFNDLGGRAAEKLFKFGVAYNYLRYLHIEGNLDMALESGMGEFLATTIKQPIGKSGGGGRKRCAGASAGVGARRTGAGAARSAVPVAVKKLTSFKVTLFDFQVSVADQNAAPVRSASGKKGSKSKSNSKGADSKSRAKKGGGEAANKNPALQGPMNALAFVKAMFGAAPTTKTNGKAGAKPARARPAPTRREKGGKTGDSKGTGQAIFFELYKMILEENAEDFEMAIPFSLPSEASFLDMQHPQHEMKDSLLCHATRHNKKDHVVILLKHGANPTCCNGSTSTPMSIARAIRNLEIFNILKEAVIKFQPVESIVSSQAPVLHNIQSLGLVHAKLSRDTISHLASNMVGLTDLDITGGFVGAFGAKCLSDALSKKPNTLVSLSLGGNSIGCSGAVCVGTMLSMNDNLTYLDLSSNDIGDVGAAAITRSFKRNNVLAIMKIGDNPIAAEAVKKMLKVARKSDSLQVSERASLVE